MPHLDVRAFILLAVMLPTVLVTLLLTSLFLSHHYNDLERSYKARLRAVARQLGTSAEFGIFSGNVEGLRNLADAARQGEPNIVGVAILDTRNRLLASVGRPPQLGEAQLAEREERLIDQTMSIVLLQPILRSVLPVDDAYGGNDAEVRPTNTAIGLVLIEVSRHELDARRNRLLLIGASIGLFGLLLGLLLAVALARRIARPLQHMTEVVRRIGEGELPARVQSDPTGALHQLESGINVMAERISRSQHVLREEVARATTELRQRKEEAERTTLAKSRFLAAASHDLRQPLHALGLFTSRLAQYPHSPEVAALVDNISASVHALQDLLDALLDISRLDAGAVEVKRAHFSAEALCARLASACAVLASEKGLRLRLRPGRFWLYSDPLLVERIAMNLVGNAIRYTERGGVLVACRRRGDRIRLEVWDSGPGIAATMQQEIFDEYVQIGNPERGTDKGLGLGLAICKRLAKLLDHRLGLASRPGHGSVFWLELPPGCMPDSDQPPIDERRQPGSLSGTVLIIDDDTAAAAGLIGLIASWGCRVLSAKSADEAIALCTEADWPPDVAICDPLFDGGGDGLETAQRLRAHHPAIAIVLIGSEVDPILLTRAQQKGYTVLHKPVRPARLRALLHHLLSRDSVL